MSLSTKRALFVNMPHKSVTGFRERFLLSQSLKQSTGKTTQGGYPIVVNCYSWHLVELVAVRLQIEVCHQSIRANFN